MDWTSQPRGSRCCNAHSSAERWRLHASWRDKCIAARWRNVLIDFVVDNSIYEYDGFHWHKNAHEDLNKSVKLSTMHLNACDMASSRQIGESQLPSLLESMDTASEHWCAPVQQIQECTRLLKKLGLRLLDHRQIEAAEAIVHENDLIMKKHKAKLRRRWLKLLEKAASVLISEALRKWCRRPWGSTVSARDIQVQLTTFLSAGVITAIGRGVFVSGTERLETERDNHNLIQKLMCNGIAAKLGDDRLTPCSRMSKLSFDYKDQVVTLIGKTAWQQSCLMKASLQSSRISRPSLGWPQSNSSLLGWLIWRHSCSTRLHN